MNKGSLIYRRYLSVEKPHPFWFYICGFNITVIAGLFTAIFCRLMGRYKGEAVAILGTASYAFLFAATGKPPDTLRGEFIPLLRC